MEKTLKALNAKIVKGELLTNYFGDGFKPLDYRSFSSYPRALIVIDARLSSVSYLKKYLRGSPLDKYSTKNAEIFLQVVKIENETGLKYGDWVKFHRPLYNDTIEGFLEEPMLSRDEVVSNIERTQFHGMNSWQNYVVKGCSLKEIKENLIEHKPSILTHSLKAPNIPSEVLAT